MNPFSVIASIGTACPVYKIPQSTIYPFMAHAHGLSELESARLKKIYDLSGIDYRHSVIDDYNRSVGDYQFYGNNSGLEPFPTTKKRAQVFETYAAELGYQAAIDCFSRLPAFNPDSITHLITVSCTGFHAPGIDIELTQKLGLRADVERSCINFMGCYAGINALKIADYICKSGPNQQVLIVNVELCTLHFQKENTMENWLANALFADGASATLVHSGEVSLNALGGLQLMGFLGLLVLEGRKEMGWKIGDYGFEMKLSSKVSKKIKAAIHSVAEKLLAKVNLRFGDIDQYAIHPGGRRILEVCELELNYDKAKNGHAYSVLRNFGNMSSATIFYVLKEMFQELVQRKAFGENILSFAFGPGLTFESMVLQFISPSTIA